MTIEDKSQQIKKHVIITQCLADPCPGFYTDTMTESLSIVCKNPKHKANCKQQVEKGKPAPPIHNLNQVGSLQPEATVGGVA